MNGQTSRYNEAFHGLLERRDNSNREYIDAYLETRSSNANHVNIFDDFVKALEYPTIQNNHRFRVPELAPQVLQGHRLWASASSKKERFIAIDKIEFRDNTSSKEIWMCLNFAKTDVSRINATHSGLMTNSGLDGIFRQIKNTGRNSRFERRH